MSKPIASLRRIDQLKDLAYACGLTSENAKPFGKLSKTSTWEALLDSHKLEFERVNPAVDTAYTASLHNENQALDTALGTALGSTSDHVDSVDSVDTLGWTNDGSFPVCGFTRQNSTFLDWVDSGQLIALLLASAGVFVLAMNMWRQINPLNLFPSPVRINIQIGTKL